jgi:hypothetical protein
VFYVSVVNAVGTVVIHMLHWTLHVSATGRLTGEVQRHGAYSELI